MFFCIFLLATLSGVESPSESPTDMLDMMAALQASVADFSCEFEGKSHILDTELRAALGVGADGAASVFSGRFVYAKPGKYFVDSLHRDPRTGKVLNRILNIDEPNDVSEYLERDFDAKHGEATKARLIDRYVDSSGCLGSILTPFWRIRQHLSQSYLSPRIENATLDGRSLKLLSFTDTNVNRVVLRYWIDLGRNGHIDRSESYTSLDGSLAGTSVITLKSFPILGENVWFPIAGVREGYGALSDTKPRFAKHPTQREEIYILLDTLTFNRNPPASVFKIDYKPGTPISDQFKKLRYEFGLQQPPEPAPFITRETAEKHLQEQLALANAQRKALVAPPPTQDGFDLSRAAPWIFGTAALICSTLLILQRRRS